MESLLYQGHRILGGINHFWMALRMSKTSLVIGRVCTSKTDENVPKVKDLVTSDRCLTVRMISSVLYLNRQTAHKILTFELGMRTLGCYITTLLPVTLPSSWTNFWPKKGISVVPQPPYSPYLSPWDFFLFPKLKFHLKGRHFETVDDIQKSWQTSWWHFYMKTSSTATDSGCNVSGSVWLPKGTALKGIMLIYR